MSTEEGEGQRPRSVGQSGQLESDSDLDIEEEEMAQRGNGRWSLKDLPQFHGKRDGIEHPSTHLMEFEDALESMGMQVRDLIQKQMM